MRHLQFPRSNFTDRFFGHQFMSILYNIVHKIIDRSEKELKLSTVWFSKPKFFKLFKSFEKLCMLLAYFKLISKFLTITLNKFVLFLDQ